MTVEMAAKGDASFDGLLCLSKAASFIQTHKLPQVKAKTKALPSRKRAAPQPSSFSSSSSSSYQVSKYFRASTQSSDGASRRSSLMMNNEEEELIVKRLEDRNQEAMTRLLHCLNGPARKWAMYEFFYSGVDRPYFSENIFVDALKAHNLDHISRVSRIEWSEIRKVVCEDKIPKRMGRKFFEKERIKLNQYRNEVRVRQEEHQRKSDSSSPISFQPSNIPQGLLPSAVVNSVIAKNKEAEKEDDKGNFDAWYINSRDKMTSSKSPIEGIRSSYLSEDDAAVLTNSKQDLGDTTGETNSGAMNDGDKMFDDGDGIGGSDGSGSGDIVSLQRSDSLPEKLKSPSSFGFSHFESSLSVGQVVSAYCESKELLQRGRVLSTGLHHSYRVQFDRGELGSELCQDINIVCHGLPNHISVSPSSTRNDNGNSVNKQPPPSGKDVLHTPPSSPPRSPVCETDTPTTPKTPSSSLSGSFPVALSANIFHATSASSASSAQQHSSASKVKLMPHRGELLLQALQGLDREPFSNPLYAVIEDMMKQLSSENEALVMSINSARAIRAITSRINSVALDAWLLDTLSDFRRSGRLLVAHTRNYMMEKISDEKLEEEEEEEDKARKQEKRQASSGSSSLMCLPTQNSVVSFFCDDSDDDDGQSVDDMASACLSLVSMLRRCAQGPKHCSNFSSTAKTRNFVDEQGVSIDDEIDDNSIMVNKLSETEVVNAIGAALSLVEVRWERLKQQRRDLLNRQLLNAAAGTSTEVNGSESSSTISSSKSKLPASRSGMDSWGMQQNGGVKNDKNILDADEMVAMADQVFTEINASLSFLQSEILSGMQ